MGETSVTAASPDRSPLPGDAPPPTDGRLTRAARTRAAVVDALLSLNEEGNLRPTARDIAAKAGVSLRSLYVHFDDLEALFVAASERHAQRMAALLPPLVTEGTFDQRLEAFLTRRTTIHEQGAGVRRAALLQEPFSPALQQALSAGRRLMRSEVRAAFAPEIDHPRVGTGQRLQLALESCTSAATWDALRLHQHLDIDTATGQVRDMVQAFVTSWGPAPADAADDAAGTRPPSAPAGG